MEVEAIVHQTPNEIQARREQLNELLENRKKVREVIESVGEDKIRQRMESIESIAREKGHELEHEELRRFAAYSFVAGEASSLELLPKGWVSIRLDESFHSSLCEHSEITYVSPETLVFRDPTQDWKSNTDDDKAYIIRSDTPGYTVSSGWQRNQDGTEDNLSGMSVTGTEELSKEQLASFVHPNEIAVSFPSSDN